jgi:NTE family protein
VEILGKQPCPFKILSGISAGAINCAALAMHAEDFAIAVERLTETWLSLTPSSVYRTDPTTLLRVGSRWMKDLTSGGLLGASRANHLLDTAPLRTLLQRKIDLTRLAGHFASGALRAVALSATNYLTGSTITFFDGVADLQAWQRYNRIAVRCRLNVEHVMASSAIPMFFTPVMIDGKPFGDGVVRMTAPISPAIHLGAEKVLTIGIRYFRSPQETIAINRELRQETVTAAEIGGVLLNALFLDSLDSDLERLERINRTLSLIPAAARRRSPDSLRPIPSLALRPSRDVGKLAAHHYDTMPAMVRYLLRGIGATENVGWDLLSYLAFQPGYVSNLIELGYEDTLRRREDVEAFIEAPVAPSNS